MTSATAITPGVISASEVYTLAEFKRRAALGDYALRQARRQGLRIIAVGKKQFVTGRDFLDFIARAAAQQAESEAT
ncbi:MAG: hypothetical protein HYS13_07360 [Planctomycetia bacterium]|nr:hypothetical protein [Planctomycetia bacterium]